MPSTSPKRIAGSSIKIKIILIIVFFLTGIFVLNSKWVRYVFHLARHQSQSIFSRDKISEILKNQIDSKGSTHDELIGNDHLTQNSARGQHSLSPDEYHKLLLIENAKIFGQKLYGLKSSKSYEYYVDLHRKSLGWNLTVAPAFEMKAKEFYFPIIGSFGYLGFFDETIKETWKNDFLQQGYDVYENEIGAYSTLGYFKDPIFSTYLHFEDRQLISLILHEMVHEKLYLKNDSDFSESMAVYMENVALNLYLYKQVNPPADLIAKYKSIIVEYNEFEDLLEETKKRLEILYKSPLPEAQKTIHKKLEFDNLRKRLTDDRFKNFSYARKVSEMPDLNNAFLVQNSRYTPKHKNGFGVLLKDCNNDVLCWFDGIKKLEKCDKNTRKKFLNEEINLKEILSLCRIS